ncbi:MAG: thioesterase family protein [Anaerolineae bacterium]|nr:thioesterase family protein [Anaerolineae bacterium]
MPRVKLSEQPQYEFCHPMTVRATDINYGAHLANEAVLEFAHEARAQFFAVLGFKATDTNQHHLGMIIGDVIVNYKAEAFLHDRLEIDCQIDELKKKSFRFLQRIRRGDQIIALIETGMVSFDYQTRSIAPLPEKFLSALNAYRQ